MTACIYCFQSLQMNVSWRNLVHVTSSPLLCSVCNEQLKLIQGNRCVVCSRQSKFDRCLDCQYWQAYFEGKDPLKKNISIYHYNDFMREIITKWKYRGDYILGTIFKHPFEMAFNEYYENLNSSISVTPIPLSEERLYIRGFNQAEMLASFLKNTKLNILMRQINEKQAKKTKMERMNAKNPFKLLKTLNKSVVLVDDIYTTGRTLRHAAQLLKDNGCDNIYALTLCRA